ncbi:MAG: hypothetical protein AAB339_05925, partial [Elusimicrobiota bacterium]
MRPSFLLFLVLLGYGYFHGGGMANQASRFDAIAAFFAFNMLSVAAVSPMMPDGREHGGLWSLLPLAGLGAAGFFLLRRKGALLAALLAAALSGNASAAGSVADLVRPLEARHPGLSGLFVLDRGEDSLLARYWMIEHASKTIDAQYFIWTADNVGILAAEALLFSGNAVVGRWF